MDSISDRSICPDESSSRDPKTALTIALGATCPVIDLRALSNSDLDRVPSPFVSNLEKRASAV